jgi:hypothetical protein
MLDTAKEQWGMDERKPEGTTPTLQQVHKYLPAPVKCPTGGTYTLGPIGQPPKCSISGHTLY